MEKTIQINPDFLQSSTKRYKRKKKEKNKEHSLKANSIKKELLKKIKEHQIKSKEAAIQKVENNEKEKEKSLDDEFKLSLDFLNTVSKEKKKKQRRKRKKAQTQPVKKYNLKDDPPYGVLKGGKKPLYREYIKTLKNKPNNSNDESLKITIEDKKEAPKELTERQKKLKKVRTKIKKRNFTLGKNLKKRRISILIKNRTIKKKIEREKAELKGIHLHDIKKFLRGHGLLKAGTTAPEDITRKIFEDAKAAGNVYNKSAEILLHNYMNNEFN